MLLLIVFSSRILHNPEADDLQNLIIFALSADRSTSLETFSWSSDQ